MPLGSMAVRFHRRLWHADCARAYLAARKERQLTAV
jgi:hypothetical protein